MILELKRKIFTDKSTIGDLYINGTYFCHVIEDKVREQVGVPVFRWKVPKQTAIPTGEYPVIMSMSERFKIILPLLLNVPGFEGVRIHNGCTNEDTEGCLCVGFNIVSNDMINRSRYALRDLLQKIQYAVDKKESIKIIVT